MRKLQASSGERAHSADEARRNSRVVLWKLSWNEDQDRFNVSAASPPRKTKDFSTFSQFPELFCRGCVYNGAWM